VALHAFPLQPPRTVPFPCYAIPLNTRTKTCTFTSTIHQNYSHPSKSNQSPVEKISGIDPVRHIPRSAEITDHRLSSQPVSTNELPPHRPPTTIHSPAPCTAHSHDTRSYIFTTANDTPDTLHCRATPTPDPSFDNYVLCSSQSAFNRESTTGWACRPL